MRALALFLTVLLIFSLPSCKNGDLPSCKEILSEILENEVGLPPGRVYYLHSAKGDESFLSDHLINALYGNGESPVMAEGWLDIALFLPSSAHACEFAVILCDSEDTATDTARLLCRRLDSIRTAKGGEENAHLIKGATVTVLGNYALLIISSDTQNAIKSASKIIG